MREIVRCRNIKKKMNKTIILNSINMTVYEGDIYGFLGPNGAGKSTTIKAMLDLMNIDDGEIRINNFDVKNERIKALQSVGAMVEAPSFYSYLSGYKNLVLYGELYNVKKDRVMEVLKMVGLEKDKDKKVSKYSVGMKQRLAIARAFLNRPKVVILDEPTNGLDPQGVVEIRNLIKSLKEKEKVTFILCSHILNEVQGLCNRIAIINHGEVIVEGELDELLNENGQTLIIETKECDKVRNLLSKVSEVEKIVEVEKGLKVISNDDIYLKVNKLILNNNIEFSEIKKEEVSLESFFLSKVDEANKNAANY